MNLKDYWYLDLGSIPERRGDWELARERLFIETTSLVTSKTILINGVDVYEKYTKQMLI